jgi:signal transduction histidine kinase
MRLSITAKFILAFLLISLTGLALASVLANWLTVREFKQLSLEQARDRFANDMALYYQANGSWDGALENMRLRSFRFGPPDGNPGRNASQDSRPPRNQAIYFVLTDANGQVVIPAGDYASGTTVSLEKLASGTPITNPSGTVGVVLLIGNAPPLGPREEQFLSAINWALFYSALGAAGMGLALAVFLARNLTRPLRALTTAIRAVAAGDLKQRVTVNSRDELEELANAFNGMSEDLHRLTQSRRQMTADIAHDLRTPLTVIGGYIESMHDGVLKPTQERLSLINTEVHRLQRLVEDLRILSQADAGELRLNWEPIALPGLLASIAQSYRPLADKQGIVIKTEIADDLPEVNVDPDRIAQVLGNCVTNSLRYTPEGGEIIFKSWHDKKDVMLAVQDTGQGISPETLPHIFDRFYRADSMRTQGDESGLGLAIAKSIIEAHGGEISAESAEGQGTTIKIRLKSGGSVRQ